MLLAMTSAMRYGTTGTASRSHTRSVTGATSSTVVTLSSRADADPVNSTRMTIIRYGLPRARLAAQIATYSKTPVRLSTATTSIIPNNRNRTFQSMPDSSEKKAASASVAPMTSMMAAPPSAAATMCTRSVAMRAYATTKTATATQASVVTSRGSGRAARRG
jgi:hypothetical protein